MLDGLDAKGAEGTGWLDDACFVIGWGECWMGWMMNAL